MTLPEQFAAAVATELGREMSWESSHAIKAQKYWGCHFATASLLKGTKPLLWQLWEDKSCLSS